jgi:hypothetical protein
VNNVLPNRRGTAGFKGGGSPAEATRRSSVAVIDRARLARRFNILLELLPPSSNVHRRVDHRRAPEELRADGRRGDSSQTARFASEMRLIGISN